MDTNSLLARLESVTARLEAVARKQGAKGGDDDEEPQYVQDFRGFVNNEVKALCTASDATASKVTKLVEKAYNNVLDLMVATTKCSKPKNAQEIIGFLGPAVNVIKDAEQLKFKRSKKFDKHHAAFYEFIMGISWVTMAPPYGMPFEHVKAQADATQFHSNKILKIAKDQKGDEQKNNRAFVKALADCNKRQVAFVKEYFKTGLVWNPKGVQLADYKPGESAPAPAAAPAATEEKKEEKKKPAAAPKKKGGIGNVFGELKKRAAGGDSAAVGMKKVTRDMKNKYKDPKERSGLVKMKAKKAKVKKPSKPPSTTNRGGTWFVENYVDGIVEVTDKITTKQNCYFANCSNCTLVLSQKVKAVTIDSCTKIRVFIGGVLATVEMVNTKSVTIVLRGPCPAIQLDKCQSPRVLITAEAAVTMPKIVSSNISAGNIEIPGKTPDDDSIEIPLPEQYETLINAEAGTLNTTPVDHGG